MNVQRGRAALVVPQRLAARCLETRERREWLECLPDCVEALRKRWSLTLAAPFDGDEVSCSWVAPATRKDGSAAVLKLGMPHMEGRHEIDGLRFWGGDPTVRLIEADEDLNAMLLEACKPGTDLRSLPEPEQDVVIAQLLRRLWRSPRDPHPFASLAEMITEWGRETRADHRRWPDSGLVREGLRLFGELPGSAPTQVLLAN